MPMKLRAWGGALLCIALLTGACGADASPSSEEAESTITRRCPDDYAEAGKEYSGTRGAPAAVRDAERREHWRGTCPCRTSTHCSSP